MAWPDSRKKAPNVFFRTVDSTGKLIPVSGTALAPASKIVTNPPTYTVPYPPTNVVAVIIVPPTFKPGIPTAVFAVEYFQI